MPPLTRKLSNPIKVIAKPFKRLKHTFLIKLDASQVARKAATELKRRLPFTNLNFPRCSEITIYTESRPSGINANIRSHGKECRPDLRKVDQKLVSSLTTATRGFYYEHQENCLYSTAASLEEMLMKDTRRVCKMRTTVTQVETIVEVEDVEIVQSLREARWRPRRIPSSYSKNGRPRRFCHTMIRKGLCDKLDFIWTNHVTSQLIDLPAHCASRYLLFPMHLSVPHHSTVTQSPSALVAKTG